MKLRQRISALVTAGALMFTFTDPAALGGMLNMSGTAFAAESTKVNNIKGSQSWKLTDPVAGQQFWGSEVVKVSDESIVNLSKTLVTWYNSADDTPAGTDAGYNKTYYVKIKFFLAENCVADSSIRFQYYLQKTGSELKGVDMEIDGNTATATIRFDDPTAKPATTRAEFMADTSLGINPGMTNYKRNDIPCHTTHSEINNMLPKTATIFTEDEQYTINAPIYWTSDGNLDITEGSYNSTYVDPQSFTVRGTIHIPSSAIVSDDISTKKYYVTAELTVLGAEQLEMPVSDTDEDGQYTTGITIKLTQNKAKEIYYTISENENGPDPIENTTSATNLLYKNGIRLAGSVGEVKTYYIKAIAYHPDYQTSEVALFKYTIYIAPSSMQNIPEVHLLVDEPVGGQMLDTTAERGTPTSNAEQNGIALISSVAWIGSNINGRADYDCEYSISIQLTAHQMHAFNATQAYVNGKLAKCSTNSDGTLTVTYTFPNRTEKLKLYRIVPPSKTYVVENGTPIARIGELLPTKVKIEAPEGTLLDDEFSVRWDLNTSEPLYNPAKAASQSFTITGTVTLPDYMTCKEGENTVKVNIFAGAAGALAWPTASPSDTVEGHMFYEDTYVTLTASENATIYYTIGTSEDVETPTVAGGKVYTSPILLSGVPGESITYYIKAIATAPGKTDSPVNSFAYTIMLPKRTVADPTANYESGQYEYALNISLNCNTAGSVIYYTTDPSAPLSDFKLYSGVFQLSGAPNTTTAYSVRFYAADPDGNMYSSNVVTRNYIIAMPKDRALDPYPNYASGDTYDKSLNITLKCDTPNTEIYYTINAPLDPANNINGKRYTGSFKLDKLTNRIYTYVIKTYAKSNDLNVADSVVAEYTFTIGIDYGVKEIKIISRPKKYSYRFGERLNVSGGQIKVTYDDGKVETVYMTTDMIEDYDPWDYGQQTLTVYYKGCTDTFNVLVRRYSDNDDSNNNTTTDDGKTDTSKDDNNSTDTGNDQTPTDDEDTVSDPTMDGSSVKGWYQLQKKLESAKKSSRVKIYLNGTSLVPADIINAGINKKLTLEFVVNDSISWVVDCGKLNKTVSSMSAGVRTKDVYIPSVLIDGSGDSEIIRLHTYGRNKIGAVLYVKTGCTTKNRFANLFRFNESTNQLDFTSTSKITTSTGTARLTPDRSGDYVIMLDTVTRLPGDADNSTVVDLKDALAILKMCVGLMEKDETADYNGDGFVNIDDARDILNASVGLMK